MSSTESATTQTSIAVLIILLVAYFWRREKKKLVSMQSLSHKLSNTPSSTYLMTDTGFIRVYPQEEKWLIQITEQDKKPEYRIVSTITLLELMANAYNGNVPYTFKRICPVTETVKP